MSFDQKKQKTWPEFVNSGELLWQHVGSLTSPMVRILIGFGQELNSEQDEVGRGVEEISRCRLPCGRKVYRNCAGKKIWCFGSNTI